MVMMIQFECLEVKVPEALDALRSYAIGKPRLLRTEALPPSKAAALEFEDRAQAIAKRLRPRSDQEVRREALKFVLDGKDTFFGQQGEKDSALRNATGALSKSLRKFDRYSDSPLELIVTRYREVFPNGPEKGSYRGTRYVPTPLGNRVGEILRAWGEI